MKFFGNKFKLTLLLIFFFELLSLLGHFVVVFNLVGFFVAILALIILSIKDLRYGLYFLFAELFIGSFGRLFAIEIFNFSLSIRIAIWLSIMIIWIIKSSSIFINTKSCPVQIIFKSKRFQIFIPLFLFIVWGFINAFLNQNLLSNIINDANAWVYFSIIIPIFYSFKKETIYSIMEIFLASVIWISVKSFFVLFIFSHKMFFSMSELYIWIRDTRIGEITSMESGFVRIFFQSHIYVLIATFIIFLIVSNIIIKNKSFFINREKRIKVFSLSFLLSLFLAVDLLNQSRSNWVGLFVGISICFLFILFHYGWRKMAMSIFLFFCTFALSLIMIVFTVKFPFPKPDTNFNTSTMLSERSSKIKDEAGASSRFALLPKLWDEIKSAPILGKGFGSTVEYKSSDPRVLENNPDGLYTTFTFEWGWLDIWLKLGLFGFLAYLYLLLYILIDFFKRIKQGDILQIGFFVGLIVISCVSFFSPYMNHPLGIGYLILAVTILSKKNEEIV